MDYGAFMSALERGTDRRAFLLAGEESWYVRRAERRLVELMVPAEPKRADAVRRVDGRTLAPADLIARLETVPLLGGRQVLIVDDAPWFSAAKAGKTGKAGKPAAKPKGKPRKAKGASALESLPVVLADLAAGTSVIFESRAKPDRRLKLAKALEGAMLVLEAEPERPWTVGLWLDGRLRELGRSLSPDARDYLMALVAAMARVDLGFLDNELSKLALYTENAEMSRADLERGLAAMPEVSAFAVVEAVNARDVRRALAALERQLRDGVYTPLILAGLVRGVRQLWQCKELMAAGVRGKALGPAIGMNPYIAEKLGAASRAFDAGTLRRVFLRLADADYLLKSGQGGPALLESAVIELCR